MVDTIEPDDELLPSTEIELILIAGAGERKILPVGDVT